MHPTMVYGGCMHLGMHLPTVWSTGGVPDGDKFSLSELASLLMWWRSANLKCFLIHFPRTDFCESLIRKTYENYRENSIHC